MPVSTSDRYFPDDRGALWCDPNSPTYDCWRYVGYVPGRGYKYTYDQAATQTKARQQYLPDYHDTVWCDPSGDCWIFAGNYPPRGYLYIFDKNMTDTRRAQRQQAALQTASNRLAPMLEAPQRTTELLSSRGKTFTRSQLSGPSFSIGSEQASYCPSCRRVHG